MKNLSNSMAVRNISLLVLAAMIITVIINSHLYIPTVWIVYDWVVLIVALLYTIFGARRACTMVLLWLPVLALAYMWHQGYLLTDHYFWLYINATTTIFYAYLIGAYLRVR